MNINECFLFALKSSLKNEKVNWTADISADRSADISGEDWLALFQLAEKQHILPLIYEAVYDCPAAREADPAVFALYKQRTVQTVMLQTMKTSAFLELYQALLDAGVTPLVVKGIVCRELYPNPDYRFSGDEDILIPEGQFDSLHEVMMANGLECAEPDLDVHSAYEAPYGKRGSPLYIEAHKSLFPPDSEAYGKLNGFFGGVADRAIDVVIDGVRIRTMGYTDHLFYLICHAFKHFLHSGFGIRQVCDIVTMANAYGSEVDWMKILEQAKTIHAERFAASVFRIGEKYLTFDPDKTAYPDAWRNIRVDEGPMLADLLSGGVYGAVDMERLHSSTITLNAVAARKRGKRTRANIWKSVFPGVKAMSGRYPYLRRRPYLLPVAWADRLVGYGKELASGKKQSAAGSMKIGEQRVELLRLYGILDED